MKSFMNKIGYGICVLCLAAGVMLATKDSHAQDGAPVTPSPWAQPQEFDWYVLMFYHETGKTDEEGDPVRQLHGRWFTVLEGCAARIKALREAKPEHITIDAIVCFPIKKQPGQTRPTSAGTI